MIGADLRPDRRPDTLSPLPAWHRRSADWCFRNRHTGRITIGQWPNLPLWLFGLLSAADWLLHPDGRIGDALRLGAALALVWWAADEVLRGVNPWRRVLGAGVLVWLGWKFFA